MAQERDQLQGTSDLFDAVSFQHVTLFDIVESRQLDTAFHALIHFLDVILFSTQRLHGIVTHNSIVANDADSTTALDTTTHDTTAGNGPHPTDRKRLEDQQGTKLDDWQMRALTHACRVGKEALLSDPSLKEHPLAIAGRGSKLLGGTIRAQLTRDELQTSLLGGFLPKVDASAHPQVAKRLGLTTLGLPYAADAGITRHLAAFLHRGGVFVKPTAILFNGGVTASHIVRERLLEVLAGWGARPKVLSGAHPDLAVSRGAAYYAQARQGGGMRIKGGTVQAYYVGIDRGELAVPGVPPKIDALCIAPFGMDEGSEVSLAQTFGLVVGEPVSFKFFGSASRKDDKVGAVVDPSELTELSPIETAFEGEGGRVAEVTLQSSITEVGTLELFAVERATKKRWQLSFNVRVQ